MRKYLLLLSVLFCCAIPCAGQYGLYDLSRDPTPDPYDELTFYSVGLNGLTNNVFMGRQDSTPVPYLSAYAGYQFHFGLYVKAGASFLPQYLKSQFDNLQINVGYDHQFGRKVLAGINFEKNFYQRNSRNIKAWIDQDVDLYVFKRADLIEPTFGISMLQGVTFSDVILSISADHNFRFKDNRINFIPMVTLNYGSSNFYNTYFQKRLKKFDSSYDSPWAVQNAGNSKPLDLELSAKTTIRKGEWLFTVLPTVYLPLSAEKLALPKGSLKEKTENAFTLEIDVCYRHERK